MTFAKPRNIIGLEKNLPPNEMEKLILANIEITDGDLRQLAARHAQNVKELLLQSGNIAADIEYLSWNQQLLYLRKKKKLKAAG